MKKIIVFVLLLFVGKVCFAKIPIIRTIDSLPQSQKEIIKERIISSLSNYSTYVYGMAYGEPYRKGMINTSNCLGLTLFYLLNPFLLGNLVDYDIELKDYKDNSAYSDSFIVVQWQIKSLSYKIRLESIEDNNVEYYTLKPERLTPKLEPKFVKDSWDGSPLSISGLIAIPKETRYYRNFINISGFVYVNDIKDKYFNWNKISKKRILLYTGLRFYNYMPDNIEINIVNSKEIEISFYSKIFNLPFKATYKKDDTWFSGISESLEFDYQKQGNFPVLYDVYRLDVPKNAYPKCYYGIW